MRVIKKGFYIILFSVLFSGCLLFQNYYSDGEVIPPLSKEIIVEVYSGSISIVYEDTDTGSKNVKHFKQEIPLTKKGKTIYLQEGKGCKIGIRGNHTVVISVSTIEPEASFRVKFKSEVTDYIITNAEVLGKYLYFSNQ